MSDDFDLLSELDNLTPRQRGEVYDPVDNVTFRCTACEHVISKGKQTRGWEITAVALDGPHEGEEFKGTLWYSKSSAMMFTPRAASLGVTIDWMRENGAQPQVIADQMVGAIFSGNITKEEFNKRFSNKIDPLPNSYIGHDGEDVSELGGSVGADEFSVAGTSNPVEDAPPPQDSSDAVSLEEAAKPAAQAPRAAAAQPAAAPASAASDDDMPWDLSEAQG